MAFLDVRNLYYAYPNHQVLKGLTFSIDAGQRVGIVGANGAGKSTLLMHINGILALSERIQVGGLSVTKENLKQIRQQVGLVFQNPDDQLFCTSLFEDVAFGLRNMGTPREALPGAVERALEQVGLPGYGQRSSLSLSLGEKKRAAIATVLAMSPSLLCLDEPTSGLDPKGKRKLIALLRELPVTQLMVTHDFSLVQELCDTVLILHRGTLAAQGPPAEILRDKTLLKQTDLY